MNQQDQQWQQQQDDLRHREQTEHGERERLEKLEQERLEREHELELERQAKLEQHDHDYRRELEDATHKPGFLRTLMQILFSRKDQSAGVEKQNVEPVFSAVADPEAKTQGTEGVTDFFPEQGSQPQSNDVSPAPTVFQHQIEPSIKEAKAYPGKLILALVVIIAVLALSWTFLSNEPVVEQPAAISAAEPSLAEIADQTPSLETEQTVPVTSPTPSIHAADGVEDVLAPQLDQEPPAAFEEPAIDLGETFPSNNETAHPPITALPHDIEIQITTLQRDVNDIKQLLNDILHQTEQLTVLSTPEPEPEPEVVPVAAPAPVKTPVARRAKPAPKPSVRLVSVDMWDGKPSVVVASTRSGDSQTLVMRPGDTVNGVTLQSASATERSASFLVNGKTTKLTVEGQ